MVKKEDKIAYEIEIERSEEMEQEIDRSINQMNDEFRMTRTAAELTDLQKTPLLLKMGAGELRCQ